MWAARQRARLLAAAQAHQEPLPEWVDATIKRAQLKNQRNAQRAMKVHDKLPPERRTIATAVCIDQLGDHYYRSGLRGFDAAEEAFRHWLEAQSRQ